MQLRPVPLRAASTRGTPLPGCAWPAVLAYSHHRHETRSAEAADRQSNRAGRTFFTRELFASAYDSLWTGRDLCQRPRRAQWRRPWLNFHARLRNLRRSRSVGSKPWPAILAVRFLVAPKIVLQEFMATVYFPDRKSTRR